MRNETVVFTLRAVLSQLQALAEMTEAALAVVESQPEDKPAACTHPENARLDVSTFGWKQWVCKLCHHIDERQPVGESENPA